MKLLIISNTKKDEGLLVTSQIAKKLDLLNVSYMIDTEYSDNGFLNISPETHGDIDFITVVGGDGSVIDASAVASLLDVPLFGVNLGKVGYLSEVEPCELHLFDRLVRGEYKVESRMLLSAQKINKFGKKEICKHLAVNDVVISHDHYFGISDIKVENGRGNFIRYRADGVIVATPIGSTAYSFSAGGPIISHSLDSLTVTPICSHNYFNRSVVYDSRECIKVSNSGSDMLNVSVDGRFFAELSPTEECLIKKSKKRLKIVTFSENNMFSALFNKIKTLEE